MTLTRRDDGRLFNSNALEINAVEHCNLSCSGCSHVSPLMPRRAAAPAAVGADLARLATVYRAAWVKIVGGEPLLHPDLPELVRAVRASGVAERVAICTNGLLLPKAPPELWGLIDLLEVSCYPGTATHRADLPAVARRAAAQGVETRFVRYRSFRVPFLEEARLPPDLARRVYRTCKIAHHWMCHTVQDGLFFKCPQAYFLPRHFGLPPADQGIALDGPDLAERLAGYLAAVRPLAVCARCLGTVGKSFAHRQIAPRRWREDQAGTVDELLDAERLRVLERDPFDEETDDSVEWHPADPGAADAAGADRPAG